MSFFYYKILLINNNKIKKVVNLILHMSNFKMNISTIESLKS